MGETTKLANLINPQVIADFVDQKLIDKIVFAPQFFCFAFMINSFNT